MCLEVIIADQRGGKYDVAGCRATVGPLREKWTGGVAVAQGDAAGLNPFDPDH